MMSTVKWTEVSFLDFVYIGVVLSLTAVTCQSLHQSCHGRNIFPNISGTENNSSKSLTDADFQSCDALNQLIELMEDVNILTARTTSCYSLKTIMRNVGKIDNVSNKRKISVTFYFEENLEDLAAIQGNVNNKQTGGTDSKAVTKTSCQSAKSVQPERHFMSMHQQNGSQDSDRNNSTEAAIIDNEQEAGGLSHTQIVAIATCAAVIGTFFLVAAALRIRNYVKRKRQEQVSRQSNCRSPSGQGSTGYIVPQSHRDSDVSKTSRQSSSTVKGGNMYFQVNNGMSSPKDSPPKQNSLDTKPLLVITSPSSGNTPTDSNNSIQFIDEEHAKNQEGKHPKDTERNGNTESEPLIQENSSTEPGPREPPGSDTPKEIPSIQIDSDVKEKVVPENTEIPVESEQLQSKSHTDNDVTLAENKVPFSLPLDANPVVTPDMFTVSAGLTQSDSSINSHNASYQYGNQVEYSWNSGYGNYAYCPNEIEIEMSDDDSQSPMELKITEMTNLDNSTEENDNNNYHTGGQCVHEQDPSSLDMLGESFDIPFDSPNNTDETTKLLALQDMHLKVDNSLSNTGDKLHKGCDNNIDEVNFNGDNARNQLISQDSVV